MSKDTPIAPRLLKWFDQHGRKDLPWQQYINPYRVWVSEIMLQQTQVATVIPYYQRFISAFGDVNQLAQAHQDEVLHLWTGLGYYSRARNLHKTAQIICNDYQGEFPDSLETLIELPGIGRSTAGAILAIAFKQHVSILDGNVKRVLARHFAIAGWPGQSQTSKQLWAIADTQTPKHRVADYTQAVMDLGATLCTRSKPNCSACPLASSCQALQTHTQADFPSKKPKKTTPIRQIYFALFTNEHGNILLQRRPPTGIWGGLWSFPEVENKADIEQLADKNGLDIVNKNALPQQRHTFSHYHLDYTPVLIQVKQSNTVLDTATHVWYNTHQPASIGTPAVVQKLLKNINT